MPRRTRRCVLRAGTALGLGLLAGCLYSSHRGDSGGDTRATTLPPSSPEPTTDTTTRTATETGTVTPVPDVSTLSVGASIEDQATDERPATMTLTVTNGGEREIPLTPAAPTNEGGLPLEHLFPFEGDSSRVIAFPTEPRHVHVYGGREPKERVDGCWRFLTSEGEAAGIAVENLGFEATLGPGETYTIQHHLYYDGSGGSCRDEGVYRTTAGVKIAGSMEPGPVLELDYALTVDGSGRVSIAVESSAPETALK